MPVVVNVFVAYSILKRLATPFKEWDAYKLGIIDEKGKVLKQRKSLTTIEERQAFQIIDVMILNLKKLLAKIPGGDTKLATYAAALWLMKEQENLESATLIEAREFVKNYINEESPTNGVAGGAIAGVGIGPDGEPGVDKKKKKKKKDAVLLGIRR